MVSAKPKLHKKPLIFNFKVGNLLHFCTLRFIYQRTILMALSQAQIRSQESVRYTYLCYSCFDRIFESLLQFLSTQDPN